MQFSISQVGIVMANTCTRRGRHHPPKRRVDFYCTVCVRSGLQQAPIAAKSALVLAGIKTRAITHTNHRLKTCCRKLTGQRCS
jgi:hypothetical protein